MLTLLITKPQTLLLDTNVEMQLYDPAATVMLTLESYDGPNTVCVYDCIHW